MNLFKLILLIFFISCSLHNLTLDGNIKNDIYHSPLNNFTCKVPHLTTPGEIIKDDISTTGGGISFIDDLGTKKRIDFTKIDPSEKQPENRSKKLESFLSYCLDNMFKPNIPKSTITFTKHENNYLIAIIDLPNGSTLMNASTGLRKNATLGIIVSIHGDYIYLVSTQHHNSIHGEKNIRSPEKFKEFVQNQVIDFYNTITFL